MQSLSKTFLSGTIYIVSDICICTISKYIKICMHMYIYVYIIYLCVCILV